MYPFLLPINNIMLVYLFIAGSRDPDPVFCMRQVLRMRMDFQRYLYVEENVLFDGAKLPMKPIWQLQYGALWLGYQGKLDIHQLAKAQTNMLKCLRDMRFEEVLKAGNIGKHKGTFLSCMDETVLHNLKNVTDRRDPVKIVHVPTGVIKTFQQFSDLLLSVDYQAERDVPLLQLMLLLVEPGHVVLTPSHIVDDETGLYYHVAFNDILRLGVTTRKFCELV